MSKESRREARAVKYALKADQRDREGAASAARVAAAKRDADIKAGRTPDPQLKGADTTRYERH